MKKTPLVAFILAAACFLSACGSTSVVLPKKEKTNGSVYEETDTPPDPDNNKISDEDHGGAYFSLEKNKYVFSAGEDFVLPVPTVKNAKEENINVRYNARVYDENGAIVTANVQKINLETGYYSLYFSFKDTSISSNTLTVTLIATDPEDIPLVSFNDAADISRLVQPPLYNWGTQNATWKILTDGFKNSVDGALEITAGAGYADVTHCRDGAGVCFTEPISVDAVRSFKITVFQATNEFQSRVVIGFYAKNGVYSEEFWYHPNKQAWRSYEFTTESILDKVWHSDDGEIYDGEITEIYGIYVKNTFCLDKMYVDEISYKAK